MRPEAHRAGSVLIWTLAVFVFLGATGIGYGQRVFKRRKPIQPLGFVQNLRFGINNVVIANFPEEKYVYERKPQVIHPFFGRNLSMRIHDVALKGITTHGWRQETWRGAYQATIQFFVRRQLQRISAVHGKPATMNRDDFCRRISYVDGFELKTVWPRRFDSNRNPCTLGIDDRLSIQKSGFCSFSGLTGLFRNDYQSKNYGPNSDSFWPCYEYIPPGQVILGAIAFVLAGILLFGIKRTSGTTFLACSLIFFGGCMLLAGHKYYCPHDHSTTDYPRKYSDGYSAQSFPHNSAIVPQKYIDNI